MNERIRRARERALEVLKPTPTHLEHGLGLHAQSIVCDAYGFAPAAVVNGEVLKSAVEAGASEAEIKVLTEEMAMTGAVRDAGEREAMVEALSAGGVTCIVQNAGEEGQSVKRLIRRLAHFTYLTDSIPGVVPKATGPEDIVTAKREGHCCLYLSANGVPVAEEWLSTAAELSYIGVFFELGCRMMHLTYNRRNLIGDGCAEEASAGLSDFGRAVVTEMNRVGVIVDIAHSGTRTSLEAAKRSKVPIVASHSAAGAANGHMRCKNDEVIAAIVHSGGYIGICRIPAFLGGSGDINAMLEHIDYVAKRFGTDYVAMGTDRGASSPYADRENAKAPTRRAVRASWEQLWPAEDPLFPPAWNTEERMMSLDWTNWPMFTVGLVQRGYSDVEVQKIIGGNVVRVARAVLAEAH